MAELAERVARLEERFDGVTVAIADLKAAIGKLEARVDAGFIEVRGEFSAVRSGFAGIRGDMKSNFRWIMVAGGSATLAILVAILTKG